MWPGPFLISQRPVVAVSSRHAAERRRRTEFSRQSGVGASDLILLPRETVQRYVAALPATTVDKYQLSQMHPRDALSHARRAGLLSTATSYTTKLSCLCRVRCGGVNCILGNSRLSPTEHLKRGHVNSNCRIHTATPNTTETELFSRVWCGGAFCVRVCQTTGRTPTQNALVGRPTHTATLDKTRPSRLPIDRRRDAGQAGS